MDSIELSLILDCFGDQNTIKNTKTYTIWLEIIAKVLNMLIELKCNNYYSKMFKRVNYKLQNNTFWVVIIVLTEYQLTNIFTKTLDSLKFEFLRKSLGICLINWSSRVICLKRFVLIVHFLFIPLAFYYLLGIWFLLIYLIY